MHMAWVRQVCGRLESRYRYSSKLVYNNYPWPTDATDAQKQAVGAAAQGVLDARAKFPTQTLADLYDPLAMPKDLRDAHRALDRAGGGQVLSPGGVRFQPSASRVSLRPVREAHDAIPNDSGRSAAQSLIVATPAPPSGSPRSPSGWLGSSAGIGRSGCSRGLRHGAGIPAGRLLTYTTSRCVGDEPAQRSRDHLGARHIALRGEGVGLP